jgi:hypothetical protein
MSESLISQLHAELKKIELEIEVLQTRRNGVEKLLATYSSHSAAPINESADLPTIQLAQRVLEKNGSPMATADIRRAIQRTFGTTPASSLQQMLYIRAQNKKVFYNENKKYGLLVWKGKK